MIAIRSAIPLDALQSGEVLVLTQALDITTQLVGLTVLAGVLAAILATGYRWLLGESVPRTVAILVGLSGIALYLNTTVLVGETVGVETTLDGDGFLALFALVVFLAGTGGALVGRRVGDHFGDHAVQRTTTPADTDVRRLVETIGRVTVVELPTEIADCVGYDPVTAETKADIAGRRFVFPRSLAHEERRERLIGRLKADHGVGHAEVELDDDGDVDYLAVGKRAAGIGPTLPPATNAVAIRADPAHDASAGDIVQVWETDPMKRVLTGELRGVAEDVVTVAVDASDTRKLNPRTEYRLVTLPVTDRPAREFASLLRAAEETFSSVTVEAGSPLHGLPIGALDVTVVALKPEDAPPVARPGQFSLLQPGETLFVIARPERLRRLEQGVEPLDPGLLDGQSRSQREVGGVDETTPQEQPQEPPGQPETTPTPESAEPTTIDETDGLATADETDGLATADESGVTGQADSTTFAELKAEFDDEPADTDPTPEHTTEPDADTDTQTSDSSFAQLKEEFESGEAAWAEEESTDTKTDQQSPAEDEPITEDAEPDDDDLVSLEEAEISFDDDDDLSAFDVEDDDDDDDLAALDFDDDDDDDLAALDFDDDEEDEESEKDSDEENNDDDDDDSGSGSSFAALKEEFESGEADWADDISDSPGGDMRLDE